MTPGDPAGGVTARPETGLVTANASGLGGVGRRAEIAPGSYGAIPLRALVQRNPGVDWARLDDVIYGFFW